MTDKITIDLIEKFVPFLEPYRYKVAHGGRGCVHPDTLIDTPKGQVKIKDFNGGDVYSWADGRRVVATATKPKKYTIEQLYCVRLDCGKDIIVTDEHKFLTQRGWVMLKNLSLKDTVCVYEKYQEPLSPLGTIAGTSPLTSLQGDQSLVPPIVSVSDFKYSKIRYINKHSRQAYWDLHVFNTNNYLSNGIVNHNSGKSWAIAQLLVLLGYRKPLRVLCAREIQKSIQDSVLQLLSDQIDRLGLQGHYDVQRNAIYGVNGTRFIFEGLRSNITKIKSMEGIDVCWIEEAEAVSSTSWNTLTPTIRKDGSEIWISFNPLDEMDETYQRFVANPPENTYCVQVNYQDNPFFPEELRQEMESMKASNHDLYRHVWEGEPLRNRRGAYYAKYIKDDKIIPIPVESTLPVSTYWDLGVSDSMSIWFAQVYGREIRLVNYYENEGEGLPHYIDALHRFRDQYGIVYDKHYAPHDINVRELTTGKSRLETARKLGINFIPVPNIPIQDGIHAARSILSRCYFDEQSTKHGVRCLKNYRREFDEKRNVLRDNPLHDWSSHCADAFRYLAVAHRDVDQSFDKPIKMRSNYSGFGL